MNIQEFYGFINEDYNEVIGRLKLETRIKKYVLKFADDNCFRTLADSVRDKNYKEAFRASHTLKGICLNLGFGKLHDISSEITEKLRNCDDVQKIDEENITELVNAAEETYAVIISGIKSIE